MDLFRLCSVKISGSKRTHTLVADFRPTFKNTQDGKNFFGDYMKKYAIDNEMLNYPQRKLTSSFEL